MEDLAQEEKLTLLLTHIFDWVETREGTGSLDYKGISLRGAMERYYYFDGISRPISLKPLLTYAAPWRKNNKTNDLSVIYDEYIELFNTVEPAKKISASLLTWFRIGGDYYRYWRSRIFGAKLPKESKRSKIGFFVINDRFIDFFQDYDYRLNQEQKLYFSPTHFSIFFKNNQYGPTFIADYPFKSILRDLPLSPNHKLYPVYFRLCFYFMRIYSSLKNSKPEVLIFAEGTSHYDELASQAAVKLAIPTLRLQSGRAAILHSGYRDMKFDVMLNWGEGFNNWYGSVSPNAKQIDCGYPPLDDLIKTENHEEKRSVLVLTQPVAPGVLSEKDYSKLVRLAVEILRKDTKVKVLVRMHPADRQKDFFSLAAEQKGRVQILNAPEYTFSEVILKAGCTVSFASTTISESVAFDVIPILLKVASQKKFFPFPEDYGVVVVVESVELASEAVNRIIFTPSETMELKANMQKFRDKFFSRGQGEGLTRTRIIEHIRTATKVKTNEP